MNALAPSLPTAPVQTPASVSSSRLATLHQKRLPVSQILKQAQWFVLWHNPSGQGTPFGFAMLEETSTEFYGYSLWARQNGRIQPLVCAIDKGALARGLQNQRCELTSEAATLRSFLKDVTQQLIEATL